MTASGRRFSVELPDWGQDHLSAEAVAAYVDGELAERPYDRATRHLATCGECAAQVVAQGQASAALQSARCPSLPSSLMKSLRSIPQSAQVPRVPNGLAMSPDGQVVAMQPAPEPPRSSMSGSTMLRSSTADPPAGLAAPPAETKGRRGRLGAGAAFSGLALGALALGAAIIAGDAPPSPTPGPGSGPVVVDAHLQLPGAP